MLAKNNLGILAAISAPFFIALSITFVKLAGVTASPLAISGIASVISLPFLFFPYLIKPTKIDFAVFFKDLRSPFLQVLFTRAILGQILIVTGFTITTAVKSILLLRLEPAFVLFWSVVFRLESPNPLKVLATLFLIVGALIVVGPKEAFINPNLGDWLIALSLFVISYSYIPAKKVMERVKSSDFAIVLNAVSAVLLLVLSFFFGNPIVSLTANVWLMITLYAVDFFVIALTLYFYALKTVKPWVIASLLSLEVVYGIILAFLVFKETMAAHQILGATVILLSTIFITKFQQDQ
jgi:drug/metabolite transporter (DMT)-like permease